MSVNLTSAGVVYDATSSPAQLSGTGSANILDDYEEGTWTATVAAGSISSQTSLYTKIARSVFINSKIIYGGDATDAAHLSGLPFTVVAECAAAWWCNGTEASANAGPPNCRFANNSANVSVYAFTHNDLHTTMQSAGQLNLGGNYST